MSGLAVFFLYICATFITRPPVGSLNVQYTEESQTIINGDLVERVDLLERRFDNITSDVDRLVKKVFTPVPSSKAAPTTMFWIPAVDNSNEQNETNNELIDEEVAKVFNQTIMNHTTTLLSTSRCQHKLNLLILISTDVGHQYQRQTIRMTWGNDPNLFKPRWKTIFLVGRNDNTTQMRDLYEEQRQYGDIVLGNFYEHFFNLSFKVEMGFEWANLYCDFDYLLKGDDDVFVNIPRLFAFLGDAEVPRRELYTGNVQYQAYVFRKGKYFVTKEEYKKKFYPRYCSGGGFVLTSDVVARMIPHFNLVNPLKIDDAYVGELALAAGIDVLHETNFKMFQSRKECKYNPKIIVHHPVEKRECMQLLFNKAVSNVKR